MVPTLHFQGAPQIRHAEVQVLRTTVHRRNRSQPHCRNVHWKKNIILEKGNVMSSVPRAEAWKLNTATSWHDRGTIRTGARWSVTQGAEGIPPHPILGAITSLQGPELSTCTGRLSLCITAGCEGTSWSAFRCKVRNPSLVPPRRSNQLV